MIAQPIAAEGRADRCLRSTVIREEETGAAHFEAGSINFVRTVTVRAALEVDR